VHSVQGNIPLTANTFRLIVRIPVAELHNVSITANGNNVYIGGNSIAVGQGLPMNLNDVLNFNWQDFRRDDPGDLEIYGVSTADTSISFLAWRRD
jgi:hypothetical protein